VIKVFKYIVTLNVCLALVSLLGGAWMARTVGTQAYWAAALAGGVVALAASLALLLSYASSLQTKKEQTKKDNAVSGVLLSMLIRMGLPIASAILMQQTNSPLLAAGFMGLLTLNYLVALPLETLMSLQFVRQANPKAAGAKVSGSTVSG